MRCGARCGAAFSLCGGGKDEAFVGPVGPFGVGAKTCMQGFVQVRVRAGEQAVVSVRFRLRCNLLEPCWHIAMFRTPGAL